MQIPQFRYHRPKSLSEAVALSRDLGAGTLYLAGGTEVLPELKRGRDRAEHLVSLRDVAELAGIEERDGTLVIGAMTPHQDVAESPLVARALPVLAEAAASVGSVQVRRQGTIGGNFCGAVPCADTPPACIVGEATLLVTGVDGERSFPAEEFFLGPRQHALELDELLVAVEIPPQPAGSGSAYARFGLRAGMSVAVAAVAARVVLSDGAIADARLALGAVAPVPLPAPRAAESLRGRPPGPEAFAEAARLAAEEARPITDVRGSAEYRRKVVAVLTARALAAARNIDSLTRRAFTASTPRPMAGTM